MITLLHGDARDVLATLPAGSVQCIVTSPPYYGLRKYSSDPREIGGEPTPAAYVAALVGVFAEASRVLRDDGTLFLNLGDSYSSKPGGAQGVNGQRATRTFTATDRGGMGDRPEKNLLGVPWRVAFALQDAGWILRSDIIWSKPNPMPESVTDRPTRAHEYVFLFAKQARYFYDATAIAEAATQHGQGTMGEHAGQKYAAIKDIAASTLKDPTRATRNRRSVWTIATQPYPGSHFATMPEALIEPCVLAGSASQACETCGAAWGRQTEKGDPIQQHWAPGTQEKIDIAQGKHGATSAMNTGYTRPNITTGFAPRCACATNTGSARSIVLDPFGGSGTVARVAERFQRDSILIDLNAEYLELQEARTDGVQVEFTL